MLARLSLPACFAAVLLALTVGAGVRPASAQRLKPLSALVLPAMPESRAAAPVHTLPPAGARPASVAPAALPSRRRTRATAPLMTREVGPFEALVLVERSGVTYSGCLCFRLRAF